MILNVCNSIKVASKTAFDFDLDTVSLFACNQGNSSMEKIENALSIVYYIFMDTADYHWKYSRVARSVPSKGSKLDITGISGSKFIPYFAQEMTCISQDGGGLPALSKVHELELNKKLNMIKKSYDRLKGDIDSNDL